MTAKTKWCILASIQFTEQFSPCVVLSIHRNFLEAQVLAASLAADTYWPTTVKVLEYTDDIRKLRVGDQLLGKKIDVIMDKSGAATLYRTYDEDWQRL